MHIEKPKLPKGLSYVLKTSMLQTLLEEERVLIETSLDYWVPQQIRSILDVRYWAPNLNIDHPRLHVRAGAVESSRRKAAVDSLNTEIFPAFRRWLRKIQSEHLDSPLLTSEPFFSAELEGDDATITSKPEV